MSEHRRRAGRKRRRWLWLPVFALMLTGCSSAPETLEGTAWKITGLTAPDGTQYDEAAYDAIIGETYYRFGTGGQMSCQVGDGAEDGETYRYAYEKGELNISSQGLSCPGKVKQGEIRLALGEKGEARLSPVKASERE